MKSARLIRMVLAVSVLIALFLQGTISMVFACPQPIVAPASTVPKIPDQLHLQAERQGTIQRLLSDKPYHAITLGDSIMSSWPDDMLTEALGGPVLNAGFSGDLIENLLWRIEKLDWHAQTPNYVLILIGTNDMGWPACDIYWGVREVLLQIQKRLPAARPIVISILPRGEDLRLEDQRIRDANAALKEGAMTGSYLFLDAHDAFLCDHRLPCPLFADAVHPSATGHQLLSAQIRELLSLGSLRQ